jgi:uncharacterized protein (DUF58 family)
MIGPDRRLVIAVAAWCGAALLAVPLPLLRPIAAAAALGLVALALVDLQLLRRLPAPRLRRQLPERAFAGRAATVGVEVAAPLGVVLRCALADDPPADVIAEPPLFPVLDLGGGGRVERAYAIRPQRRGDRRFGELVALVASPLGLLRRRHRAAGGDQVLRVYPDTTRLLHPAALDPKRVLAALGVKPAPRRGDGMDFDSLRDYQPGDDPRRVDWRATARRGRLVTRQFQHERNHTVLIAVDASRLMAAEVDGRSKLDHAIDAGLALAYAALQAGDRVGLIAFDRELRGFAAPRAQRRQLGVLIDLLRPLEPRLVEPDYRVVVRTLAARHRQRALVVVLTDVVEAGAAIFTEPLAVLGRRHRVLLVALRDRLFAGLDAPAGTDMVAVSRRLVLADLVRERDTALATLRRGGVQSVDLPPEAITAAVLERYLALRYGPER